MMTLTFTGQFDPAALLDELRADTALARDVESLQSRPVGNDLEIILEVSDEIDTSRINAVVSTHDPLQRQQAEQQRQQQLASLRAGRGEALDPADYSGETAPIQTLADKLAWLEQEVLDLRGGQV